MMRGKRERGLQCWQKISACKAKAQRKREAMVLRKMAVPITNLSAEVRGTAGGADVGVEAEAGA
jgi:hypothetical protein